MPHRMRASSDARGCGYLRFAAGFDAIMHLLPAPDLSFAGSARHLRFPSLEEPGAAFADAPAAPDLDPAGAAVAPPTAVYTDIATPSLAPLRPLGHVAPP